jgi:ATP-binding cassette subfamily C protein LapB
VREGAAGVRALLRSVSPGTMAALLISSAAMVVLSFAVPLTVLQTYDRILAYGSRSTLAFLCLGCLAALVLNALLEYWRSLLGAWTAARYVRSQDLLLMDAILSASPETLQLQEAERHLERFRTVNGTATALLARSLPTLAEAPFAACYLAVLVFVGGRIALVGAAAALAEIVLALAFQPLVLSLGREAEGAERDRTRYISYALDRIHFLKAQALEHTALLGFERAQSSETGATARRLSAERWLDEAGRAIGTCATFGTIIWGGILIARGDLTVGSVSACLFFASRLTGVARNVRRALFSLADARADLREHEAGLALARRGGSHAPPLPRGAQGRLEFEDVRWTPPGATCALLDGVSFVVRPGEAALAEHPLEEGRSAICRLAAGLVEPTSGSVLLDAYPSTRWDFRGAGGVVAYVSSRGGVLPGSILENIASFDIGRRDCALDVAQLFGLDSVVSRLPRGFETRIGPHEPGGLSASALRLVTIARALALRPRLLVWDVAEADLDGDARIMTLELLRELSGATTLLINSAWTPLREMAARRPA